MPMLRYQMPVLMSSAELRDKLRVTSSVWLCLIAFWVRMLLGKWFNKETKSVDGVGVQRVCGLVRGAAQSMAARVGQLSVHPTPSEGGKGRVGAEEVGGLCSRPRGDAGVVCR